MADFEQLEPPRLSKPQASASLAVDQHLAWQGGLQQEAPSEGGRSAAYFCDKIQVASCLASASLTWGLAGMGTTPQAPEPPLMILVASLSAASFWPAYLAATSL